MNKANIVSIEDKYWSFVNYGYVSEFILFSYIWMHQLAGSVI